jgi:hypothetical protein
VWYSFLMMIAPLAFGFGVAWCIAPDKVEVLFSDAMARTYSDPGNTILCGSMVLGILAFWPWKKDNRIYFRDCKEGCCPSNRGKCYRNYSGICREEDCPKMKGE